MILKTKEKGIVFDVEEYSPLRSIYTNKSKEDNIIPSHDIIYRALELTPQNKVKVVIFGQDPYPRKEDACGLAFSVPKGRPIPSSLRSIHKSMELSGYNHYKSGDLTPWTKRGVLLLNTSLTTVEGKSNAHKGLWDRFIINVISSLQYKPVLYWMMGKESQRFKEYIKNGIIYETYHPSGRAGNKFRTHPHFSKVNELLDNIGLGIIDWSLEE